MLMTAVPYLRMLHSKDNNMLHPPLLQAIVNNNMLQLYRSITNYIPKFLKSGCLGE